jgi:cysteinyl-tRNA synthetase
VNEALKLWRADGIVPSSLEDQETDYKRIKGQGPNVTTLPDDEIWDLVTQRWRAKKSRDFERAETLETALETAGVLVDDHAREWRADGIMRVRGLLAKPPRPKQEEQPTIVPYTRSAGSGPSISLLPDDEIEELIMERLEARQDGDYEEADQILRALVAARVFVDDNFREWRSDGKRHCSKLTTTATSRSANATIEGDAQKFWSSGAVIGERAKLEPYTSSDSSVPHPSHDYVLAHDAGPNASKLSLDVIDKLLGERLQARIAGDFDAADQIRDELIQAGVFVDDKKKKWRADGVWHGYEQKGFNDSALSQGEIHARLANFQSTKIAGRYQEADEIRRELREYGVFIDDKLKQWRTTSLKSLSKDPPEELSAVA